MPTPPRPLLGLLATLAAAYAPFAQAADGDKHRPPLTPHFTAGQTFSYSSDADYDSLIRTVSHVNQVNDDGTTTRADRNLINLPTRFSVNFSADLALARQVFRNGSLREAVYRVSRCEVIEEKAGLPPLVPANSILTARKGADGKIVIALDGTPVVGDYAGQVLQVEALPPLLQSGGTFVARKLPNGQMVYALDGKPIGPDAEAQLEGEDAVETLVPRGGVITARKQKDGQIAFAVNGAVPDSELAAQLSLLIVLGNEQSTKDDMLGPPQPVTAGDSWDVNLKAMINSDLPQSFPGMSSVLGNVQFVELRNDAAGRRAVIGATYSLVGVTPPFKREFKPEPSTVSFNLVTTTPVDGGPGTYDMQLKSLVRHAAHTGNATTGLSASEAEFDIRIRQSIHFVLGSTGAAPVELANAPVAPDAPSIPPGLSAANILRPPPEWLKKHPQKPEAPSFATPAPARTQPALAAPASTAPFTLPDNDVSPFVNAQNPLSPADGK